MDFLPVARGAGVVIPFLPKVDAVGQARMLEGVVSVLRRDADGLALGLGIISNSTQIDHMLEGADGGSPPLGAPARHCICRVFRNNLTVQFEAVIRLILSGWLAHGIRIDFNFFPFIEFDDENMNFGLSRDRSHGNFPLQMIGHYSI